MRKFFALIAFAAMISTVSFGCAKKEEAPAKPAAEEPADAE